MTNVQLRADTHTHTHTHSSNPHTHTHIYGRTLDRLWDVLSSPFLESWSSWSEWSHCDSNGAQMRVRHCDVLFPTGNQCLGNNSETRPCSPDSNFIPGDFTHTHTHTHTHSRLFSSGKCSALFCMTKHTTLSTHTHILRHLPPYAHSGNSVHFQESCHNEIRYWSLWGTPCRSEVRFSVRAAPLGMVWISV